MADREWRAGRGLFSRIIPPPLPLGMWVAELKNWGGEWDEHLIRAMFVKDDTKAILSFPCSFCDR